MSSQPFTTFQTQTQRREVKPSLRQSLLARPHRSLNFGTGQPGRVMSGFAPFRLGLKLLLLLVLLVLTTGTALSQEVEDTIRIKTRVVFLDASVKDKRTSLPVSNLSQENFEVLDNGKPRNIAYFTREGQARKPLALVLILDLREDGAGRFLKRPEILRSIEDELAKLPPGDELAIMAMDPFGGERRLWLTEFTNDRAKLSAALLRAQKFAQQEHDAEETAKGSAPKQSQDNPADSAAVPPPSNEVVETETIKAKNGTVITRSTTRDGRVDVKRVSKDGKMTVEFDDVYDMAAAIREAIRTTETLRPNSQLSVVWVSDGIAPIFFEDREAAEQLIIRNNAIFNSLTVDLRTLFKFLMPMAKPVAGWLGLSLYGSAKYLAQRSGGEAVKVGGAKDYATGLSRIIGNLTARYSLGFALEENETDDGQMHSLEVRVKAKDEKGKNRKLLVSSRQGYYMSSVAPKETSAKTQ